MIAKWSGSKNISDIQKNIKTYTEPTMVMSDENMMIVDGDMMMDDSKMMDKETMSDSKDEMIEEKEVMMKKEGKFVTYSAEEVASTEGTKVLFFHAKWCPACVGAAKNLSASTAPDGLNVFKVDYDTSAELKKLYGVVGQHTFVQIDDNGKMLKRWFGSRSYEDILAQL
jgi:thiol-disulfide isomerase/thioredoxin